MPCSFRKLAVSSAAMFIALSSAVFAAPSASANTDAQQFLAAGQPAEACAVLRPQASTADPEALMLLGLCNEQLGNHGEAISFYERTLRIVPGASLVRSRLAALYLVEGRTEEAEAELGVAMSAAVIAAASNPSATDDGMVRLSVGRFYDSNINAGSSSATMVSILPVLGTSITIPITPGSRAIRDSGTSLSVQGRHVTPLSANFALMTSASLSATVHDTMSDYDRQSLGLAAGLLYGDEAVNAIVQPSVQFAFEGGELDAVRAGLFGLAERELVEAASIFTSVDVAYRHNPNEANRSAWDGRLNLGFRYALNANLEVGISYGARSTVSGRSTESYFAQGPEIGLDVQLTDNASLGLSYGYEFAAYDETASWFPEERKEDRHRFAAELNVDLSQATFQGIGLTARYEYSATDATLPLYDSERHVASVGLTYQF